MTSITLKLPAQLHTELWAHLLPEDNQREQAAFLFCGVNDSDDVVVFDAMEAAFLRPADFAAKYNDYIELTNECRIGLIKRAHKLGAALAEFHSHPGPWPAAFSPSDRIGLCDTVPHMRWRLNKRPYLAVVVAPSGYDALVWTNDSIVPAALTGICAGKNLYYPVNNSLKGWDDDKQPRPVRSQ